MPDDLDGEGPLFRQFQRVIMQRIVSGELAPGDRLPSESELVKLYGLSRQTIGKALTGLSEQGLLDRNKRAGTIVSRNFRDRFSMPVRDLSQAVLDRGGMYEFTLLDLSLHVSGQGRLQWTDLAPGSRFLHVEAIHYADNTAAQHERRFINLDAVPAAETEDFSTTPPGQWLLRHSSWTWVRNRITAIITPPALATHLQMAPGSACVVLERRFYLAQQIVSMAYLTHPGDRFALDGDFCLASSEHPNEIVGLPQSTSPAQPQAAGGQE